MEHVDRKRGTNCGSERLLPIFDLFWCLHTGLQTGCEGMESMALPQMREVTLQQLFYLSLVSRHLFGL